jgi:Fic family protein
MAYMTLEKSFYADSSSERHANHAALHSARLNADSSIRTGIELENGELFCAVPIGLTLSSQDIYKTECRIASLWGSLPYVARGAFVRSLVLDEVVNSNQIEGVHSTRRQVEVALAKTNSSGDKHTPFSEFARLYLALCDGVDLPTKPADVRAIFDAVMDGSLSEAAKPDGGLFRNGPVHIEDNRGKVIHEGVSSEEKICSLLDQMIQLNLREDVPSLFSAVLGHFIFEYIHPFYDGNGRTGRYLLALYLSKSLSQVTVLSLSRTIAENKNAYYKAFDAVERPLNCSEATPFVEMLFGLIETAQAETVVSLEQKRERLSRLDGALLGMQDALPARCVEALRYAGQMHLFEAFGETALTGLAEHLEVSKATTSKCLRDLVDTGFLEKVSARPFVCRLTEQGIAQLGI